MFHFVWIFSQRFHNISEVYIIHRTYKRWTFTMRNDLFVTSKTTDKLGATCAVNYIKRYIHTRKQNNHSVQESYSEVCGLALYWFMNSVLLYDMYNLLFYTATGQHRCQLIWLNTFRTWMEKKNLYMLNIFLILFSSNN